MKTYVILDLSTGEVLGTPEIPWTVKFHTIKDAESYINYLHEYSIRANMRSGTHIVYPGMFEIQEVSYDIQDEITDNAICNS